MAKFCGKCGSKLDKSTGLCPNCDADKLAKLSGKKRNHRSSTKAIRVILLLGVLIAGIIAGLVYFKYTNNSDLFMMDTNPTKIDYDDVKVDPVDAEEYLSQNSKILSITSADESDNVMTESEVTNLLANRGFTDASVSTEYSMDGTYTDIIEASDSSTVQHPLYQTSYATEKGEVWTIMVIEDDVIAIPVSYKLQANQSVELVVAEKPSVTSYDSVTNNFYEIIPYETVQIVKVVDQIDAETLNQLTIEELGREN